MKRAKFTGLLVGCALVVAACGDDTVEPAAAVPSDTAAPATEAPPSAIISLSPTATEMLYAIGAGDQVLAVDDFSNYPPEAAAKMSGLSGYEPNVEAIVGLEPDLVVTDGSNPALIEQLDGLGVAHWEGLAAVSFDDVYAQIEQLGAATGHAAEAAALVDRMRSDVAAVRAGLPEPDEPLTYYHELDSTLYSVTSATFIGAVYAELGLVNIADAAGDGNPYPQLSAEFILAENPDLIFLACTLYCGESAATVAARPGWGELDAVANGAVVEMNDDIASRWGPRIVEYFQAVGAAVAELVAS
ncbi:MAG TPA: ABC transporter substrate-binding protein [Ilumatobacter sp.]